MRAILADRLRLLFALNIPRAFNALVVLLGYYWSRLSSMPRHFGMPVALAIEPTTACNLGCPECPSGLRKFSRPTGNLKLELLEGLLQETRNTTAYITFYFQGEPFIHPGIFDMIRLASSKGIYTATSTNAHFLDSERAKQVVLSGLSRLIISIDGTTQEVYEQYRKGGELDKVIKGTEEVLAWKKRLKSATPHVIFQFLVVKPNQHQIPEVKRLAKDLGVDELRFKTAQVYDFQNGNPLIPDIPEYSRYKQNKSGQWEIKNTLDNHCWKMWHSCVITQNGEVVPCCFDKDASHSLGNISDGGLKAIWQGEKYRNFRAALLRSRKEIDICRNCSEGTKVWA